MKTPENRVEVQIDEDVILKTHISGLEPDSVTWVKHQSQLEINDKYSYGRKGPDYSLQINSVRWYDSGVYKCLGKILKTKKISDFFCETINSFFVLSVMNFT